MSEKQTSLLRFFGKRSVPFQESDVKGPTTSKKRKASFNRQYNKSYLKYGFISTSDSAASCLLCLICNSKLSNEAMKPSKLLWHMKTKHPKLKDKPLEFFERRKRDYKGEKRSLKTALSTNFHVLRASYLVSYRIAKTKKPFTIGEELILPACTDICHEVLGESAAKKIAQVPLSAHTVAR